MNRLIGMMAIAGVCASGCAHTPTKPGERADLQTDAQKTLAQMEAADSGLRPKLDGAVAYIVFPAVGSGGFIVGGGAGAGVLYENGRPTGFAELRHAGAGAMLGGQRYSEVVVIRDGKTLDRIRAGKLGFGADASAVLLRSGAAADASFQKGVIVFRKPVRGAMVNASVGGERIRIL